MCQWYLGLEMLTHLVQSGLRHRVVIYPEKLFVLSEDAEDVSEGGEGGGKLVLQHVSVFLSRCFLAARSQWNSSRAAGQDLARQPSVWWCTHRQICRKRSKWCHIHIYASKLSYMSKSMYAILIVLDLSHFCNSMMPLLCRINTLYL